MKYFGFEIGDTPLIEVPELSARYNARVLVKDESKNTASGTFKDRRNMHVLEEDASIEKPVYYAQITFGNSGNSMGVLAKEFERQTGKKRGIVNIVPKELERGTKSILSRYGPLVEIDLSKRVIPCHELIDIGRKHVKEKDAVIKTIERLDGYKTLAMELYDENPDCIFTPMGAGELFYSLARGFPGRDTKVIGATVDDNVIATDKRFHPGMKASVADKLACAYSGFRDLVLELCREGAHELVVVSDREILEETEYLNKTLDLDVDPNAATAFAAARKYRDRMCLDNTAVIIKSARNSGRVGGYRNIKSRRRIAYATTAAALIALFGTAGYFADGYVKNMSSDRQWQQIRDGLLVKDLKSGREWYNDYLAYAICRGGGKIDHHAYDVLKMYNSGGFDHTAVENSPGMMKVVNDYYAWRERQRNR